MQESYQERKGKERKGMERKGKERNATCMFAIGFPNLWRVGCLRHVSSGASCRAFANRASPFRSCAAHPTTAAHGSTSYHLLALCEHICTACAPLFPTPFASRLCLSMRACALAALSLAVVLLCAIGTSAALDPSKGHVQIDATGLHVYNESSRQFDPFNIKGIGQQRTESHHRRRANRGRQRAHKRSCTVHSLLCRADR